MNIQSFMIRTSLTPLEMFKKMLNSRQACGVTLTKAGRDLLLKLKSKLKAHDGDIRLFTLDKYADQNFTGFTNLKEFFSEAFIEFDTVIAVMASGIVIRMIKDHLAHKSKDPGILVCDQNGEFVISLLSGHLGRANENAQVVAGILGGQAVITTASDSSNLVSVDMFAQKQGLYLKDFQAAKEVTVKIIEGNRIGLLGFEKTLCSDFEYISLGEQSSENLRDLDALIVREELKLPENLNIPICRLYPKNLVLGIGMRKNLPFKELQGALNEYLERYHIDPQALFKIATIQLKKDEESIHRLSHLFDLRIEIISNSEIILVQEQFPGSDFVEKNTGVRAVAEPCGYIASNFGEQVAPVFRKNGITLSLWKYQDEED